MIDLNTILNNNTTIQENLEIECSLNQITDFFKQRYAIQDPKAFQKIWNKIGAGKVWATKTPLIAGLIRTIDSKFRTKLVYHGDGIKGPSLPDSTSTVQKIVHALLHGGKISEIKLSEKEIKGIINGLDTGLMKEFQQALQSELDHLSTNPPQNEQQEIVWRAFVGNILAFLPYSYPETNSVFRIPILENGVCRLVEYNTEIIDLHYVDYLTPLSALAMTPKNGDNAPPLLSFIGTTFPAGNGFLATLLADFTPGNSVGEHVYNRNAQKIDEWLEGKNGVHVFGMSLGGAMALHTLRNHHEIERVDAYAPPGLYSHNWKEGIGSTCKVNIYCQPNDLITELGEWPVGDNVSLYTVYPHQNGVVDHPLNSHLKAYTGCDLISILKEDPHEINQSYLRYLVTKWHQYAAPFVIFIPLYCMILLYRGMKIVQKVAQNCFEAIRNRINPLV